MKDGPVDGSPDLPKSTDTLLQGEDPESPYLEDADHWSEVYRELLKFKVDLIGLTVQRLRAMPTDAAAYVKQSDLEPMTEQAERLRTRMEVWELRGRELKSRASG